MVGRSDSGGGKHVQWLTRYYEHCLILGPKKGKAETLKVCCTAWLQGLPADEKKRHGRIWQRQTTAALFSSLMVGWSDSGGGGM